MQFHNSVKWCRILIILCTNSAAFNFNQISVNSVNACISYNGLSEVTLETRCPLYTYVQTSNIAESLKSIQCPLWARIQVRRCGHNCLIALSLNSLWKCSHSLIRRDFNWLMSWIRLWYRCSCSFPKSHSLALYPFSFLNSLIKMQSSAENVMFIIYIIVYVDYVNITSVTD